MEENDYQYFSSYKETLPNKYHHETPLPNYRFITSNIESIEKNSNLSYDDSLNQKHLKNNRNQNNNHIFFTLSSHNSNEENQKQRQNFSPITKNIKNLEEDDLLGNIGLNNSLKENDNNENSDSNINDNDNDNDVNEYHTGRWSKEEHEKFIIGILSYGNEWKKVQKIIKTRSSTQARSHAQKYFLKLKKEINSDVLSDPDKLANYIINSSDILKKNINISSDQKEKLMTVIKSNLRAEENLSKSGKEGLTGENYNSNVNDKDESGFDDINEEEGNLAYNKDNYFDLQKKMSFDVGEIKRKITFCSKKRKSESDCGYNKIFNITKEMSRKSSIDVAKANNLFANNLTTKNSAQKNIGNKKIKFNIKNNNNFVTNNNINTNNTSQKNNKNINNKSKENNNISNNQPNFYIQNNYINIFNTYNNMNIKNNINNCENIPNVYNNNNNQFNPNLNNEVKNTVNFFNITKQFNNQNEFDKNNISVILKNQNFFPSNNKKVNQDIEQNNPFNINFETITSNDMKRKEGYINQYIGEIFDGGQSLSEWTNNNNLYNQV